MISFKSLKSLKSSIPLISWKLIGLGVLAASATLLSGCGGGGAATSVTPTAAPTTATVNAYTGPAPATPDVQAFEVNFWNNVRGQNRCGQCHNATTPAQLPNFARSDDVNLAYAQANPVVNLSNPSQSTLVVKVSGGHNCWLADPNACGQILATWISNWASASTGVASATAVQLTAPPVISVGQSLNFPNDGGQDYEQTVYQVTGTYCQRCHSPNASAPQSPYFAAPASQIATAYQAAIPKIDFTGCIPVNAPNYAKTCGTNSRFYQRLANESHNCWSKCADNAATMLAKIQAFAQLLTPTDINPSLVVSKALTLSQGTIASGQGRYDANVIAKYEFQTGSGTTAYDTSGVDPAADLTLTGNYAWAGGWGINIGPSGTVGGIALPGGKAQATTSASAKIYTLIQATGEFSVEAWVAPALVAVDKSYMISYSGGDSTRNFTLGQTDQSYDFMLRGSNSTDLNGDPQLTTPTAAMLLQASLQHVVLTYDAVSGRQIYVNGVNTGLTDPQKGGSIANWDNTFALVLGNEVSGDRNWQGLIKFAAVHSRALTPSQVMQNFNAGVGEQHFMLFDVSAVTGLNQSYVMFTVSQYDSYSYLFYKPTFISLDKTVTPNNLAISGIQIGLNGAIPQVGQAYLPLSTTVTAARYKPAGGQVLSTVGTVVALQNGPATDQFFLSFNTLGRQSFSLPATTYSAPAPTPGPIAADVGVRTFAAVNSTFSRLTGVPTTNAAVSATYQSVQQQLPDVPTIEAFSSANQIGIAQLAIQYCNTVMTTPSLQAQMFPGVTFNASLFASPSGVSSVTVPLAALVVGNGQFTTQPPASAVSDELNNLIGNLCSVGDPCSSAARVVAVASAACATALGSAEVSIN